MQAPGTQVNNQSLNPNNSGEASIRVAHLPSGAIIAPVGPVSGSHSGLGDLPDRAPEPTYQERGPTIARR